jgi:hypothetical protein
LALVLQLVQVLVLQPAQVLESEPVQAQVLESQLAPVQVQHPLHQPPQSLFQLQPSRLLQREFR